MYACRNNAIIALRTTIVTLGLGAALVASLMFVWHTANTVYFSGCIAPSTTSCTADMPPQWWLQAVAVMAFVAVWWILIVQIANALIKATNLRGMANLRYWFMEVNDSFLLSFVVPIFMLAIVVGTAMYLS
jgi:hypothetical protein